MTTSELKRIKLSADMQLVKPLPFYEAIGIGGERVGPIYKAVDDRAARLIAIRRYGAAVYSVDRYSKQS